MDRVVPWLPRPHHRWSQETLSAILAKVRFCDRTKDMTLNDRQRMSSTVCWTGSKASSRPPNKQRLPTAHRTELIGEPGTDRAWRPGSWFRISGGAQQKLFTRSIAITNQRACARDCHRKAENLLRARAKSRARSGVKPDAPITTLEQNERTGAGLRRSDHVNPGVDKNNHL